MSNRQATAEIELLPCPFCGEAAAWGEGEQKTQYGNEQVYCSNCYAMTAPEGSKEEAAFLWNDRNDASAALRSERDALLAERDRLRRILEMMVCNGCHNRVGWNETPTKYGDWAKCSSCRDARVALSGKEGEG